MLYVFFHIDTGLPTKDETVFAKSLNKPLEDLIHDR